MIIERIEEEGRVKESKREGEREMIIERGLRKKEE